jgi:hypothetical protein
MAVPDFQTLMLLVLEIDAERSRWMPVSNCYTADRGMVRIRMASQRQSGTRANCGPVKRLQRRSSEDISPGLFRAG